MLDSVMAHQHWGWMAGGWWWMWLFMLLFLVIVIVAAVVIVRAVTDGRGGRPRERSDRAREILDERYARGEIDSEEYDERRRRLDAGRD